MSAKEIRGESAVKNGKIGVIFEGCTSVKTVKEWKKEGKEFEYLFWVGSMGSFDNRSQKIALSFAKLLNEAGSHVCHFRKQGKEFWGYTTTTW